MQKGFHNNKRRGVYRQNPAQQAFGLSFPIRLFATVRQNARILSIVAFGPKALYIGTILCVRQCEQYFNEPDGEVRGLRDRVLHEDGVEGQKWVILSFDLHKHQFSCYARQIVPNGPFSKHRNSKQVVRLPKQNHLLLFADHQLFYGENRTGTNPCLRKLSAGTISATLYLLTGYSERKTSVLLLFISFIFQSILCF